MDTDYKPVSYTDLIQSYENPVDRAWYFTTYQHLNGSLFVPEPIFLAIGAVPHGNGTYCWSNGESGINVYGQFTKKPTLYSTRGTVCVSRANFIIESPIWPCSAHYDYRLRDPQHEVAHFHPNNEMKWYLPKEWTATENYLRTGLSRRFSTFLEESKENGVDIFSIKIVKAQFYTHSKNGDKS